MSEKLRLLDIFEEKRYQKAILAVSLAAFLILELLIYFAAAGQAGQQSQVVVYDANGAKVYQTPGTVMTSYEKLVFENTFGPLRNYHIQVKTESLPFPLRAWMSAAVGIPVGLVLLVAFLVKAYLSLLYGEEKHKAEQDESPFIAGTGNKFLSLFNSLHRFSIFHIGFAIVIAVLMFWMVPNFVGDVAKVSVATVRQFHWFFLGTAVFLAFLITWIVYLRYRLSKKMLENQLDLEKFRVEKQLLIQSEAAHTTLLPSPAEEIKQLQEHSSGSAS